MSESGKITLYEGTTPATPPAGSVVLYPKVDGRFYFKAADGIEYPMRPIGAGTGDLLADGSVPLTTDWNVGLWKITANQFESVVVTGTAPLIVASTTVVANLNADLLDGQEGSYYASVTYVDNAIVGLFEDKGNYNAATNTPDLDTAPSGIFKGDVYTVSVAGVFFTANVEVGDVIRAMQDDPTTLAHWAITQTNLDAASVKVLYESNADTNEYSDAEQTTVLSVENGATADQTDGEIETAYNTQVAAASQAEMVAGTETAIRRMTPQRVWQAIAPAKNKTVSGTTYTILEADNGYNLIFTNAAAIAVTLPNGLSTDHHFVVIQTTAAGIPTVTPNTDTIRGAGTGVAPAEQWAGAYFTKYAATAWAALL